MNQTLFTFLFYQGTSSRDQTTKQQILVFLTNIYYEFFFKRQSEKQKLFWNNKKFV